MKNEKQRRWERNFTRIGTKSTIRCFILRATNKVQPVFMRVDFRSLCLLVIMCLLLSGCSYYYLDNFGTVKSIKRLQRQCDCICEYTTSGESIVEDTCGKFVINQPLYISGKKP